MKLSRFVFVGLAALALGATLLLIGRGSAGGGDQLAKSVDEVASAIEKGDMATAQKKAKEIAEKEEEIYYVMLLMKPRDKKGYGVGDKAGEVIPDGIELKIRALDRDVPSKAKLDKEADALVKMAHRTAAIALITDALPPEKMKKDWADFSKGMADLSVEFAKAVQSGAPAEVKGAAAKLNANCNNCHSKFR